MWRSDPLRRGFLTGAVPFLAAFLTQVACAGGPGQGPPGGAAPAPTDGCAAQLPAVDPAGAAPAAGVRRRALLVGISRYRELGSRSGMWNSLATGCDVELMREGLKARFGFADADIRTLTEGAATK